MSTRPHISVGDAVIFSEHIVSIQHTPDGYVLRTTDGREHLHTGPAEEIADSFEAGDVWCPLLGLATQETGCQPPSQPASPDGASSE